MGYSGLFNDQQRTINNCPFELIFTQCVFDTLGHDICVRGYAKTWLYKGTNDTDDTDDYRVTIIKAEICYDYTSPTDQNPSPANRFWPIGDLESFRYHNVTFRSPANRFWPIGDLEAELSGNERWEEIERQCIDYALDFEYDNE